MNYLLGVFLSVAFVNSVYGFRDEQDEESMNPLALAGLLNYKDADTEVTGLDKIMALRTSESVLGLKSQEPDLEAANRKEKQQRKRKKKSQRQRKGRRNGNRRRGGSRGGGGGGGGGGGSGGGGGGSSGGGGGSSDSSSGGGGGGGGGMSPPSMPGGGGGAGGMPMSPDAVKTKFEQGMQKGMDMGNMAKSQFEMGADQMKGMASGGMTPQNMQEKFSNGMSMMKDQAANMPGTMQAAGQDMVAQGKEMFG